MNRLAALVALTMVACAARSEPPRTAAVAAPAGVPPLSPDAAQREKSFEWRAAGWASIVGGSAAAIVVIGTSVLAVHYKGLRDSECDAQKVCSQAGLAANDQLSSTNAVNLGAWITAAVGLGVGTLLVLTHPAPARTDQGTTSVSVSPLGLGVRSTF